MSNRRKTITYSVKIASIFKVVISAVLFASAGLTYVYLKNQEQQYGSIQRHLENELGELQSNNESMQAEIASLTSRASLKNRLTQDGMGLVPIVQSGIVRIDPDAMMGGELKVASYRVDK